MLCGFPILKLSFERYFNDDIEGAMGFFKKNILIPNDAEQIF
jgi:hypothetical protein